MGRPPRRRHGRAARREQGSGRNLWLIVAEANAGSGTVGGPVRAPGLFAAALLVPIVTAGCTEWQSALNPGGPQAQELADLFWLFTGVCTVVWLLVMLALGLAVWRGRSGPIRDLLQREPRYERGATVVIATATAATVLVLIVFTAASFLATRGIADTAAAALRIHITGH